MCTVYVAVNSLWLRMPRTFNFIRLHRISTFYSSRKFTVQYNTTEMGAEKNWRFKIGCCWFQCIPSLKPELQISALVYRNLHIFLLVSITLHISILPFKYVLCVRLRRIYASRLVLCWVSTKIKGYRFSVGKVCEYFILDKEIPMSGDIFFVGVPLLVLVGWEKTACKIAFEMNLLWMYMIWLYPLSQIDTIYT